LAQSFPETTFVFVGTKMASDSASTAKMEETLQLRNLRWLGPKPHNELPRYLKRFDICLNPLAVSEYNHRRSLLRLYDYIATSSPILSTALKEALELGDLVEVVRDTEDCISKLRRLLKMRAQVDCESRKISMQKHTWEVRARDLWENVLRTAEHERRIPASSL
jgi:glycosyltransferase involved in cell wall biosynthesis